jgi:hypothetical protein
MARSTPLPADGFFHMISDASMKTVEPKPRVINLIQGEDWRAPIMVFLHHYYEPDGATKHTKMQQRATAYQIVDIDLYRTSISGPLLHYVSKAKGQNLLSKMHARVCGGHIGAKALATKVLQQGFYWPAIINDVAKLVSTCEAC